MEGDVDTVKEEVVILVPLKVAVKRFRYLNRLGTTDRVGSFCNSSLIWRTVTVSLKRCLSVRDDLTFCLTASTKKANIDFI